VKMKVRRDRFWLFLAAVISAGQIGLIWWHRFIPIYDYPNWLYQAGIFSDLIRGGKIFGADYVVKWLPAPNVTFTLVVSLFAEVFPLEIAGKIVLTISVLLFPWGFWYCARRFGAPDSSAIPYAAFPFGVSMFTLNAQNFTLALGMLFWFLGMFCTSLDRQSRLMWALMSGAIVLIFLTHGVVYAVLLLLLVAMAVRQGSLPRIRLVWAVTPSLILLVWYLLVQDVPLSGAHSWGTTVLARHFVKPACIFLKSYGIQPLWPPTFLNLAWMCVFGLMIAWSVVSCIRSRAFQLWLGVSGGVLLLVALMLPDPWLNVVQPGARLVFPAFFLLLLASVRMEWVKAFRPLIFGFCALALMYNFSLFSSFDRRAKDLTNDLQAPGALAAPVYIIGLDWDSDAGFTSRVAPSVNGMSFVPLYTFSKRKIPYGVFETGLVQMTDSLRQYHPQIAGSELREWTSSLLAEPSRYAKFKTILLFGDGKYMDEVRRTLSAQGFTNSLVKSGWEILNRDVRKRP